MYSLEQIETKFYTRSTFLKNPQNIPRFTGMDNRLNGVCSCCYCRILEINSLYLFYAYFFRLLTFNCEYLRKSASY